MPRTWKGCNLKNYDMIIDMIIAMQHNFTFEVCSCCGALDVCVKQPFA